jgi:transcription termination factor Rho
VNRSGTRHEELLLEPSVLQKVWVLRKFLSELSTVEAMELLVEKMSRAKSNKKFLDSMNS